MIFSIIFDLSSFTICEAKKSGHRTISKLKQDWSNNPKLNQFYDYFHYLVIFVKMDHDFVKPLISKKITDKNGDINHSR
jgi:hypothetical protein